MKWGTVGGALLAVGVAGAGMSACGPAATEEGETDYSYQGLGSRWAIQFEGDTFTLTYDEEVDGINEMTIEGTFEEFENRFRLLTITASEGENAPPVGGEAYGVEIPGYAFFLQPSESTAEPIIMVNAGGCPSGGERMNWITADFGENNPNATEDTAGDGARDAMGEAEFSSSAEAITITRRLFETADAFTGTMSLTIGTCTDGTYEFEESGGEGAAQTSYMYATSNGGMLVRPGDGLIFASPELAETPAVSDAEGTYSGLAFVQNSEGGAQPVKVVLAADGTGTVTFIEPETDADLADTEIIPVALGTPVEGTKGQFHGTIDDLPLNCVRSVVDGDELLACNGAGDPLAEGYCGEGVEGSCYPVFFFLGVKR